MIIGLKCVALSRWSAVRDYETPTCPELGLMICKCPYIAT